MSSKTSDLSKSVRNAFKRIEYVHEYWTALGYFIATFSDVEANLQIALRHLSKVDAQTARAVFSGVRISDAMDFITRLGLAQNWPSSKQKEYEQAFAQLRIINKVRNDVVHFGGKFNEDNEIIVSNERVAHTENRVREIKISPELLRDMCADLRTIVDRLVLLVWDDSIPQPARATLTQAFSEPWRYIPPKHGQPTNKQRTEGRGR